MFISCPSVPVRQWKPYSSAILLRHYAATVQGVMLRNGSSPGLVLLIVALFCFVADARTQAKSGGGSRIPPDTLAHPLSGPGDVYTRVPARDEYGRDQLAMFRAWNPDPVGNHETNVSSPESGTCQGSTKGAGRQPCSALCGRIGQAQRPAATSGSRLGLVPDAGQHAPIRKRG